MFADLIEGTPLLYRVERLGCLRVVMTSEFRRGQVRGLAGRGARH